MGLSDDTHALKAENEALSARLTAVSNDMKVSMESDSNISLVS